MPGPATLVCAVLLAAVGEPVLEQAEDAFRQGVALKQNPTEARKHFTRAADAFARLHAAGASNAALHANWGNAELLAGRVPQAIFAYRLGLFYAPGEPDLRANLEHARLQVDYPDGRGRPSGDAWPTWLPRPGRHLLFGATALMYGLACLLVARWFMVRRRGVLVGAASLLLMAGLIGYAWQAEERRVERSRSEPLVVVAKETGFFQGNGALYPAHPQLPALHAGMEGRLLYRRGEWLQVEFGGSALGWVPAEAVLVDE